MSQNADRKRRARPLYHAAKISDYRFRKVLACFVRDLTATETARRIGLSVNSVDAMFRKLRVFFFEAGLFRDFYRGRSPLETTGTRSEHELSLLDFHLVRTRNKRGLKQPLTEPPYHFAESCWRYDYEVLLRERPSSVEAVHAIMQRHLIQIIRICGPVGAPPRNGIGGHLAILGQIGERARWLQRNAAGFQDTILRTDLQGLLDKIP